MVRSEVEIDTPYGKPSDVFRIGHLITDSGEVCTGLFFFHLCFSLLSSHQTVARGRSTAATFEALQAV